MAPLADFLLASVPFEFPRRLSSYVAGETPLSTTPTVVSVLAGYLAIIFSIKVLMTNREPYKLKEPFRIHNILLSFSSALLLVLMLEEIVPQIWTHGFFHALCSVESWSPVCVQRVLAR
jgi:zinc transporter ZupT